MRWLWASQKRLFITGAAATQKAQRFWYRLRRPASQKLFLEFLEDRLAPASFLADTGACVAAVITPGGDYFWFGPGLLGLGSGGPGPDVPFHNLSAADQQGMASLTASNATLVSDKVNFGSNNSITASTFGTGTVSLFEIPGLLEGAIVPDGPTEYVGETAKIDFTLTATGSGDSAFAYADYGVGGRAHVTQVVAAQGGSNSISNSIFAKIGDDLSMSFEADSVGRSTFANATVTYKITPELPDIVMDLATTTDSKSVSVDYQIKDADITQPLEFNIYRSASPTAYDQSDLIATATLAASDSQDLSMGDHTQVRLDLGEEQLDIDPARPYVIVVANPDHTIVESDKGNDTNDTVAFRKYVLGVVTHGFSLTFPQWVNDMAGDVPGVADSLKADGYNNVISFDWTSYMLQPDGIVLAGLDLRNQIVAAAKVLVTQPDPLSADGQALPGSVVDLHLIGHSRGSVVISQAFLDLAATAIPELQGGFKRMTMLDPHPANNSFGFFSFGSTSVLGWLWGAGVTAFQAAISDPQVVVPANVNQAEVYYQHTDHTLTPTTKLSEQILNLWGEDTVPQFAGAYHVCDLTSQFPMGHSEVHDWYQTYVVNPNLVDDWPPFCPSDPPSPPPSSSSDVGLLYPQFVDNRGVAQSLVSELASARTSYGGGDLVTTVNILGAFIHHVQAQAGKHITPDTSKLLISVAQFLTQELGTTSGQSAASAAAMTAEASLGGALMAPSFGMLQAGDWNLYIDNSAGAFTSDELARVEDATASVDATVGPYDTRITEVGDRASANIVLDMGSTSFLGGYADGVLGCETNLGEITIIQGWNWYAGSDATAIVAGQYDFQTVVTHELGHALGLGHSANAASVMYATLTTGATNRALAVADLNVPDSDTGGACGLHAAPNSNEQEPISKNQIPTAPNLEFGSWFFEFGILAAAPAGYPTQRDSPTAHQTALNAVLVDWPSAADSAGQVARILDDKEARGAASHSQARLAGPAENDDFWSAIGLTPSWIQIIN